MKKTPAAPVQWKLIPGDIVKEFDREGGSAYRIFFSRDGKRSYPRMMIRVNHVSTGENQGITMQCCIKRDAKDWVEQVPVPLELLPHLIDMLQTYKFNQILEWISGVATRSRG